MYRLILPKNSSNTTEKNLEPNNFIGLNQGLNKNIAQNSGSILGVGQSVGGQQPSSCLVGKNVLSANNFFVNTVNSGAVLGSVNVQQPIFVVYNPEGHSQQNSANSVISNPFGTLSTLHSNGDNNVVKNLPRKNKKPPGKIFQVQHYSRGLSCEGRNFQCKNSAGEPRTR